MSTGTFEVTHHNLEGGRPSPSEITVFIAVQETQSPHGGCSELAGWRCDKIEPTESKEVVEARRSRRIMSTMMDQCGRTKIMRMMQGRDLIHLGVGMGNAQEIPGKVERSEPRVAS